VVVTIPNKENIIKKMGDKLVNWSIFIPINIDKLIWTIITNPSSHASENA